MSWRPRRQRIPSTSAEGPEQFSGVGEIRTHGTVSRSAVFKTAAFNHSATTPGRKGLEIAGCRQVREVTWG
jgi:hypothetical protein